MTKTTAKTITYLPLEIRRNSEFKGQHVRLLLDSSFESVFMFDYFNLSGAKISAYAFDIEGVEKWYDIFTKKCFQFDIIRDPAQTATVDLSEVWVAPTKLTMTAKGINYEYGSFSQFEGVQKFRFSAAIEKLLLQELVKSSLFKTKKIILNDSHIRSLGLAQTQVYFHLVTNNQERRNFFKTTAKTAVYLITLGLIGKAVTGANFIDYSYAKDTKPGDPQPCYHPVSGNPVPC